VLKLDRQKSLDAGECSAVLFIARSGRPPMIIARTQPSQRPKKGIFEIVMLVLPLKHRLPGGRSVLKYASREHA